MFQDKFDRSFEIDSGITIKSSDDVAVDDDCTYCYDNGNYNKKHKKKLVWACEPVKHSECWSADPKLPFAIYIYPSSIGIMSRYYQLIIQVETRKLFGYLQSWIGWEQMVDVGSEIKLLGWFKHFHQFKCLPSQWYWPYFSDISKIHFLCIIPIINWWLSINSTRFQMLRSSKLARSGQVPYAVSTF